MIGAIVQAVAGVVTWFFSERRAKAKEQAERDRIAAEVAAGDEDAVNARLGRFRCLAWLIVGLIVVCGCCTTVQPVYVREHDKVRALRPGEVYTNDTDVVEWIVPRAIMTRCVIGNEGL